jgi:hypothetical protein
MGIKGFKSRLREVPLDRLHATYQDYFTSYCLWLRETFGADVAIVVDAAHLLYVFGDPAAVLAFVESPFDARGAGQEHPIFAFDNPPAASTSTVKRATKSLDALCGKLPNSRLVISKER